jgi:hypothetical protein
MGQKFVMADQGSILPRRKELPSFEGHEEAETSGGIRPNSRSGKKATIAGD